VSLKPVLRAASSALLLVASQLSAQQRADLILFNGDVWTVDSARPHAQAIAVARDRIIAVGSDAEILRLAGPRARRIDLKGRMAMPGFIDGHGHYLSLGESKMILDLTTAKSWDDIVSQVATAVEVAPRGSIIEGRGWHQEKWNRVPQPNVEGIPLHASLDRVSPNNPVILEHASGHASFVNGAALAAAGVTRTTANPPGGEIVTDSSGEPTGLLRESAQGLMRAAYAKQPKLTPAQAAAKFKKQVDLAGADALSKGVTSFHDAGTSFANIDGFKRLADAGQLPIRLYVMVRFESDSSLDANLDRYRMIGYGGNMLTVR
jgi:predicted amidohydrolase YtcJ